VRSTAVVGAALLERRHFGAAAQLIDQPITWDSSWKRRLWARHALTNMANDAPANRGGDAQLIGQSLAELDREAWFLGPFGDRARALERLCQFDFLQCAHVAHLTSDAAAPYPSFCHYWNHRTEPIIATLQRLSSQMIDLALLVGARWHDQLRGTPL
jgi:hypothetical protein